LARKHVVVTGAGTGIGRAIPLARIVVPSHTGYPASKAGLLGLVRSLAAERAPRGVQVDAICPGWVDREMAWQASTRPPLRTEARARTHTVTR
jgi:NAD(P)-dependent dehydrogenase (short-subunit alcohol dehydrogenase family)